MFFHIRSVEGHHGPIMRMDKIPARMNTVPTTMENTRSAYCGPHLETALGFVIQVAFIGASSITNRNAVATKPNNG